MSARVCIAFDAFLHILVEINLILGIIQESKEARMNEAFPAQLESLHVEASLDRHVGRCRAIDCLMCSLEQADTKKHGPHNNTSRSYIDQSLMGHCSQDKTACPWFELEAA